MTHYTCLKPVESCDACNWFLQEALEQHCLIELSAVMEMVSICTVQRGGPWGRMAVDS